MTIYLDVFFIYNFFMDFVLLFFTEKILNISNSFLRMILSAAIGGIYGTVILVCDLSNSIVNGIVNLMIGTLMIFIAFGRVKIKEQIRRVGVFYISSIFLGGIINYLYFLVKWNGMISSGDMEIRGKIKIQYIFLLGMLLLIILSTVIKRMKKTFLINTNTYNVLIGKNNEEIFAKALCDTGNSLIDPIFKRPVSIINESLINFYCDQKYLIPYSTLGSKNKLMETFVADYMKVGGREYRDVIIGISKEKLSKNDRYNMLLNPLLLKQGEDRC